MKTLLRLRPFLRPYLRQVALATFFLLSLTALELLVPDIIRRVIDIGLAQRDMHLLRNAALLILAIGILNAGFSGGQRYLSEWIASHLGYDIRNRMYDHIQHLSFAYHDHAQTGQLISRSIEDLRSLERFVGFGLIEIARLSVLALGVVALLFIENARLAWIAMLPLIPLVGITVWFGRRISSLFLDVDNNLGELSSRLQENVTGAQVVRAFAREPYEIARFDETNRALYHARVTVVSEWSKVMPTTRLLAVLGTILILWFGGSMVLRGEMTVGQVVAFNSYMVMLALPARQLVWLVNMGGEALAGTQRVFEVLDTPQEIASPPQAASLPPLEGRVDFEGVSFHYQGEQAPALQDIHLHVEPNQIVALIGATGSGKTTLVNLIPRFYDVTSGAVRVDGRDVRQVHLPSLRRQIGIVLQTSLLFSASVRENIAFGRPDASMEEIEAAARAAQAHDFITRLPEGYDTLIGERGMTLSGGQRQRIAIARALLMDPRILILDDSTSSVDMHTERLIQQALDTLMQGRTTFVIAHRISTVRRADLILVMEEGRIVQRGTHKQLIAQPGPYREIYELQLQGATSPAPAPDYRS
ncbi:MAG: ABC transporter ATP-binding protein [Anaerolineae bacterium]|nr:MAG: ABC transporter ATP-binding protein [Anaerolineae bacterium]